jgi:lipopolysaccharide transport system ATP-binding protein
MTCVLHIDSLSKEYRLGLHGHGMLFRDIQSWWARVRGKEDPNSPVGTSVSGRQKSNGRIWALKDVSFEVKQGEVLGIIGRNGAGKSTLLKILSRVTAPTRGEVRIKGRVASLLEVGTGFHPELTGRENIFLNGAIMGMSVKEISKKFDEIVDFAGVERYINTPVKRYSSGMYVRLAFAVAAHLEPEILLVDEVLAVGDAEFQKKCLGKMGEVSREGRTLLFVSHNLDAIATLCRRVIWIDQGKVAADGASLDIVSRYLVFGEVAASHDSDGAHHPHRAITLKTLTLADAAGARRAAAVAGRPIDVVVEYAFDPRLQYDSLLINLIFGNGRFPTLFSCPMEIRGDALEQLPSQGRFRCRIPAVPLVPGIYEIRCAALLDGRREDKFTRHVTVHDELHLDDDQGTGDQGPQIRTSSVAQFIVDFQWKTESSISRCETTRSRHEPGLESLRIKRHERGN